MGIQNLKCSKCGGDSFIILPVITDASTSVNLIRFIMDRDALPDITARRRGRWSSRNYTYPRAEQIRRKISAVGNKQEELRKYDLERVKNVKSRCSKGFITLDMEYRERGDTVFKKASCQLFKSSKEIGITCTKCGKVYTNVMDALDREKTKTIFDGLAEEIEKTRTEELKKIDDRRKKQYKSLHDGLFEDD